jgi:hypothetical protein
MGSTIAGWARYTDDDLPPDHPLSRLLVQRLAELIRSALDGQPLNVTYQHWSA